MIHGRCRRGIAAAPVPAAPPAGRHRTESRRALQRSRLPRRPHGRHRRGERHHRTGPLPPLREQAGPPRPRRARGPAARHRDAHRPHQATGRRAQPRRQPQRTDRRRPRQPPALPAVATRSTPPRHRRLPPGPAAHPVDRREARRAAHRAHPGRPRQSHRRHPQLGPRQHRLRPRSLRQPAPPPASCPGAHRCEQAGHRAVRTRRDRPTDVHRNSQDPASRGANSSSTPRQARSATRASAGSASTTSAASSASSARPSTATSTPKPTCWSRR